MATNRELVSQNAGIPQAVIPAFPKPTITEAFKKAFPEQVKAMWEDWAATEAWRKKTHQAIFGSTAE